MRKVGPVVRAGMARRWTRPLFLGIASLSVALVVVAGCTPIKPTPPPDTPDTTAPGAPSTPNLTDASDRGASQTDNITNDTTPAFTGTAEAGSTVKLLEGGTEIGSGTATGGAYSVTTSALAEGDHTITATATDAANNTSPASSGLVVTIDVTAPAGPSTPLLDALSDSGTPDDGITNDNTPTVTGTAVADTTVTIHDGGTAVGTAPASGGNYSVVTSALPDGDRAITATASDVAGNTSAESAQLMITIDTSAPVVSISTPANGAVANDNTPALSGAAENAQVTVSIYSGPAPSGTPVQTLTPSATSGAWSDDAGSLADGIYTVQATQGDTAGNVGTSSTNTFTVDTVAPLAPSTPDLVAASDTGTSNTDDLTGDTTPTFIGTAEADSLVRILADGIEVGSGTATGGNYSITTSALTDDVYDITATTTDAANNPSAASGGLQVTIDSTVPAVPSTPDLDAGSDTGTSSADENTSDSTPTFTGTAEDGSTVRIFSGLTEVGSGTATGGSYNITTSVLPDGVHSITATATDVAGTSPASGALSVTVDTTDPTVAVVAPADGAVTNDDTPSVSGTASLDSTVTIEIYAGPDTTGTLVETLTPTAPGGLWSDTVTALADGEYTVEATQTDAAGNAGTSTANTFTVDTSAPADPPTPDLDAASDTGTSSTDDITSDTTPTFTGTAEAGSLVRILADGVEVGSGTATGGNYSITTSALTDDEYDITATATDIADNTSGPSGVLEVTIDGTVPAAPSTPDLDAGRDSGTSSTDDVTSDTTPTFTGTAEPGSLVRIFADDAEVGSGPATGGNYSITTLTLPDGFRAITATATNVAGTSPPPTGALVVAIDTTPPAVTVTNPADNSSTSDDTPLLAGTAENGLVTVTIYEGPDTTATENQTRTPTVDGGVWSDTATTLAAGTYTIEATQEDAAGNVGQSVANTFTVGLPGISGTVTNPGGAPAAGVSVGILDPGGVPLTATSTDIDGNYFVALPDGDYKVGFANSGGCAVFYDDEVTVAAADVVTVAGAAVTDIDGEFGCGTISGQVTNAGGDGISGVAVGVLDTNENLISPTLTSPNGDYSVSVQAGDYKVGFLDTNGVYASEFFDDEANFDTGDTVAVVAGADTPVSAVLTPGSGTISGDVEDGGGDPLAGVEVVISSRYSSFTIATTMTDASGHYTQPVSAAEYKVQFKLGTCVEYFDDEPGFATADVVTVPAGGSDTADAELDCATISGTVTDAGGALRGVPVQVFEAGSSSPVATATTDASGHYEALVGDGDYKVVFGFPGPGQCGEFYDNKADLASADVVTATGVDVVANAELTNCATISGTVTSAGGAPVVGLFMPLRDAAGNFAGATATDASGHYTHLVTPGDYTVEFGLSDPCGEFYDNKASLASADVTSIADGGRVTANAQLSCSIVSGTVTGPTGDPLSPVAVRIYTAADSLVASMITDASGNYSRLVAAGDYKVQFDLGGGCGEWYNDKPDQASADVVGASGTDVTASAGLPCDEPLEEGEISGTVAQCFGEDGCSPCGEGSCGILVQLHTTSGTFLEETGVVDGQYSLEAPPGDYKIRFIQAGGCVVCPVTEWYDDKPDLASADVVHVTEGGTVTADAEIEFVGGI